MSSIMFDAKRRGWPIVILLGSIPAPAAAQAPPPESAPAPPPVTLPSTEVIGTSPLLGSGIDRDKIPANTRSLSSRDLRSEGPPDLAGTLDRRIGSINLNEAQNNPFQPDILYRGFTGSPLNGTPQGLAVYQNGIRINEPFGDAINWDLIPDIAIDRTDLIGSNPVFGLNALGGALAIQMKNGFGVQGGELTAWGGSFGRRAGSLEYGKQVGSFAGYIAATGLNEDGWRTASPSQLRQLYGDVGRRGDHGGLNLTFSGADNRLTGNGPAPVELLAADRDAVFTQPDETHNKLAMLGTTAYYDISDNLSFQGNAYYRSFSQRTLNADRFDAQPCDPAVAPGILCLGNSTTVLQDQYGRPIANFLGGLAPGITNTTSTSTVSSGGSLQMTERAPLFDLTNQLVVGLSLDHGETDFHAEGEIGAITPIDRGVTASGLLISQPDGTVAPVRLRSTNSYYGFYATDTANLTQKLALTLGGRFNFATLKLSDQLGSSLNGSHDFAHFNPAAGATYALLSGLTLYAGYAVANRAPTPAELSCADPGRPCSLSSFFLADPALKQVVTSTYEAGVRGRFAVDEKTRVTWNLGLFRADSDDDILNVSSPFQDRGFFQNVGVTRRQGIEAGLGIKAEHWSFSLDYSFVDATFQHALTLNSPNNPAADDKGQIHVRPGDHIPGVPQNRLKLGADYALTERWKIGGNLIATSGQFLRGDESNLNPKLPGYAVVNLHTSYDVTDAVQIFGLIQNLFDTHYATFGNFANTAAVPLVEAPGASNPRSISPAPPLAAFAGLRINF